jgi:uncharacterized membrane protein
VQRWPSWSRDGPFTLWDSIAGIVLMVFLVSHVNASHFAGSVKDTLLYATVWSICVLLILCVAWSAALRDQLIKRDKQAFDPFNATDVWGFAAWLALLAVAAVGVRIVAKWRRSA